MTSQVGLTLIRADHLEQVAAAVATDLTTLAPDPFSRPVIMVRHHAVREYLQLGIARQHGLAASLDIRSPARLLDLLQDQGRPEEWESRKLRWRIAALLPGLTRQLPAHLRWLSSPDDPLTSLGFARQLANRYHQLQLYRPDVILAWEAGELLLNSPDEGWQQQLWLALTTRSRSASLPARQVQITRRVTETQTPSPAWPTGLVIVSDATLPPLLRQALHLAAGHIAIRWYLSGNHHAPAPDRPSRRSAAWHNLQAMPGIRHETLTTDQPESAVPATLLARVQRGITQGNTSVVAAERNDQSLTFHRCHSPQREIETLHELITAALARDASLQPHDFTIYLARMTDYVPAVDAVFEQPEPGSPWLPWHLAGRPWHHRSRMAAAVRTLLNTLPGRFGRSEVLTLLEHSPIRLAAEVNAGELVRVEQMVEQARIRWGVDADDRMVNYQLPGVAAGTWRHGLAALMATLDSGLPEDEAISPDLKLLQRLNRWLEKLAELHRIVMSEQTPTVWRELFQNRFATLFVTSDSNDAQALKELLSGIDTLLLELDEAAGSRPISFRVIQNLLAEVMEEQYSGSQLRGGVRITQLLPGNVLPGRVVLFAGFDDEHYPIRDQSVPWDPLLPKPGEGNQGITAEYPDSRQDALEAFLDAVASASDAVHLAWTGRSWLDNSIRSASVAVDDLISRTLQLLPTKGEADLIRDEPLQPFSSRLFEQSAGNADRLTPSSSQQWLGAARALSDKRVRPSMAESPLAQPMASAPALEGTSLAALGELVSNPPRYFWQRVLQLRPLRQNSDEDLDREPVRVGEHDSLGLNRAWLNHPASPWDPGVEELLRADVETAPQGVGRAALMLSRLATAAARPASLHAPLSREQHSLNLDGRSLSGNLHNLSGQGMYLVFPHSLGTGALGTAWVQHLLLNATRQGLDGTGVTWLIGSADKLEKVRSRFRPLEQSLARQYLADLLSFAAEVQTGAAPLFPRSGLAWAGASPQQKPAAAAAAAMGAWQPSFPTARPERSEPMIQQIFGDRDLDPQLDPRLWAEFTALAERVYLPLAEHLEAVIQP